MDVPISFNANIVKRFMDDNEFRTFVNRYREARFTMPEREIPKEYFEWLDLNVRGMSIAQIARQYRVKQMRVRNGMGRAAIARIKGV